MDAATTLFAWHSFDVTSRLPKGWAETIVSVGRSHSRRKDLIATSVTSRELSPGAKIPVLALGGVAIRQHLQWMDTLYRTLFLELGQSLVAERLSVASDQRYAINLNVQVGSSMRYECHVDSNPLEGLLYATTHPPGSGGELVVSNVGDVAGIQDVDADATRIYPIAGQLIFFDATQRSHYVAPLRGPEDVRVVVAMNYYTPSRPESARPSDLNRHLGLE
jgi:hypothetical protein